MLMTLYKMIMKDIFKIILVSLLTGSFFLSCETIELDLAENPNALTPESGDVNLFLNNIQLTFVGVGGGTGISGANNLASNVTRIDQFFGRNYFNDVGPTTIDGIWGSAYAGFFQDIVLMTPAATEQGLFNHLGVAQSLQAYYLVTLVDLLGDVPFSQANNGAEFPLPMLDDQEDVYAAALDLLDQSDANFNTGGPELDVDFFYENDFDAWRAFNNTQRLRIAYQTRLVNPNAAAEFDAIIASGVFISDPSQDFRFPFGNSFQQPSDRHPDYTAGYLGTDGTAGGEYQSLYLMNLMQESNDPRIRYFFYRQTDCTPGASCNPEGDQNAISCSLDVAPQHYVEAGFATSFCFLENGYWGRPHGDNNGIPPDNLLRTAPGVFPGAGRFDDDRFEPTTLDQGGQGGGIAPILLTSHVDFYRTEMAIVAGDNAAASNFLRSGIERHIELVQSFIERDPTANDNFAPTADDNADFVNSVVSTFDNAATNEERMNILGEQFFISLYGAGMDAYNFYRRTGAPFLQPNIEPNPGNFPRSFFYPVVETSANSNIPQKPNLDQQVFWDTNPPSPAFPASN